MINSNYVATLPKGTIVDAKNVVGNGRNNDAGQDLHKGFGCDLCNENAGDIKGQRYHKGEVDYCEKHFEELEDDEEKEGFSRIAPPNQNSELMNRRVYVEVVEEKINQQFDYLGPFKFDIMQPTAEMYERSPLKLVNEKLKESFSKKGLDIDEVNEKKRRESTVAPFDVDDVGDLAVETAEARHVSIGDIKEVVHGGWASVVSDCGYILLQQTNDIHDNLRVDKSVKKLRVEREASTKSIIEVEKERIRAHKKVSSEKNNLLDYVLQKKADEAKKRKEEEEDARKLGLN
jgi:hypothetical protein